MRSVADNRVIVFDTTLRDGEQAPGFSMGIAEKLRELIGNPIGWGTTFSRENGESYLGRHFAHIDRFDMEIVITVRERAKLVAYRDSVTREAGLIPEDVELPFIVHGRVSIFVATA